MDKHHKQILQLIKTRAGKPTKHTFLDSYLGTGHLRYPIDNPTLRIIAKTWMREHKQMKCAEFASLLTNLIKGESFTEKTMAGMLLDYSTKEQQEFNPKLFNTWLNHLEGWAEVDVLCTSKYTINAIPGKWSAWEKQLTDFSVSKNLNKRRASLVLFCGPVRNIYDERFIPVIFGNIDRLKHEKNVFITKAISWILRSMVKRYKAEVTYYVKENVESLPRIAVRETTVKLKTGKKNPGK